MELSTARTYGRWGDPFQQLSCQCGPVACGYTELWRATPEQFHTFWSEKHLKEPIHRAHRRTDRLRPRLDLFSANPMDSRAQANPPSLIEQEIGQLKLWGQPACGGDIAQLLKQRDRGGHALGCVTWLSHPDRAKGTELGPLFHQNKLAVSGRGAVQ